MIVPSAPCNIGLISHLFVFLCYHKRALCMTEHTTLVHFLHLIWCDYVQLNAKTLPSTVFASHEHVFMTSNFEPFNCTHHAGLHCMLTVACILAKSSLLSNDVLHMNRITVPAQPNSDHLLHVDLG